MRKSKKLSAAITVAIAALGFFAGCDDQTEPMGSAEFGAWMASTCFDETAPEGVFYVSGDCSEVYTEVAEAVENINETTAPMGLPIQLCGYRDDAPRLLICSPDYPDGYVGQYRAYVHTPGVVYKTVALYYNKFGRGAEAVSLTMHEFGHFYGLPHSDDTGSVMYPYLTKNTVFLPSEVAAIEEKINAL